MNENTENLNVTDTEEAMAKLVAFVDVAWAPFPKGPTIVNQSDLKKHLTELKTAVENDLNASRKIIERENKILQEARRKADELVKATERQIANQDVIQQANSYAKQIVEEAQRRASNLLSEGEEVQKQLIVNSHKYVENLFDQVEEKLDEKREEISRNRKELRASLEARTNEFNGLS